MPTMGATDVRPTESAATPPAVEVRGVRHDYGTTVALQPIDLTIAQGQFYTLLGPSGSGKTTLLRIVAGLLSPTGGHVSLAGRDVTRVEAQERNIGFVFQNYALFPHLSVRQNVEFPLKLRGVRASERKRRVDQMLDLVRLGDLADRQPGELSGGQQQRVAIGRALVFDPEVLLLDEPLGALDRRLRQQLGAELRRIQQQTGISAIYVTHDQEESFILSDTVVVMNEGAVHQIGTPADVYARPADHFVATFLGDTNILRGVVAESDEDGTVLRTHGVAVRCAGPAPGPAGSSAACSLRPEDIEILGPGETLAGHYFRFGEMTVVERVFLGGRYRLTLDRRGLRMSAEVAARGLSVDVGAVVDIGWKPNAPVILADQDGPSTRNSEHLPHE
jgi:ABC-type Fe3+/spermidine/putrescine transport system ATPase subunit